MIDCTTGDQDYELWLLLRRAGQAVKRNRDRELSQYGLSSVQAGVLVVVEELGDKAIPAEISRHVLREAHSVSSLLTRMETQGLVKKVRDLDKANLVRISLTDRGRQALRQSGKRESIRRVMSVLSEKERHALMSSLKKIRDEAIKEPRKW